MASATSSSATIMFEALRDVSGGGGGGGGREGEGGADSLLPIVSSQRERFKQRNVELEAVRRVEDGEEGRGRREEEGGRERREGGRRMGDMEWEKRG